ncbi:MAG: hypothetical protein ACN4GR_09580, partial [Arenicellales bacterium]
AVFHVSEALNFRKSSAINTYSSIDISLWDSNGERCNQIRIKFWSVLELTKKKIIGPIHQDEPFSGFTVLRC